MELQKLQAKKRTVGKLHLNHVRKEGLIPGVVFGAGMESIPVSINYRQFHTLAKNLGESTLLDLELEDADSFKVLVTNIQKHILKDKILHIDFRHVRMDQEIEATMPLHFIGDAPIVKESSGVLVKNVEEVQVKCLPTALVDKLDVDLSVLISFESRIYMKNLMIPAGIALLENPEDIVVSVSQPQEEKEVTPVGPVTVDEVKKVGDEEKAAAAVTDEKKK